MNQNRIEIRVNYHKTFIPKIIKDQNIGKILSFKKIVLIKLTFNFAHLDICLIAALSKNAKLLTKAKVLGKKIPAEALLPSRDFLCHIFFPVISNKTTVHIKTRVSTSKITFHRHYH